MSNIIFYILSFIYIYIYYFFFRLIFLHINVPLRRLFEPISRPFKHMFRYWLVLFINLLLSTIKIPRTKERSVVRNILGRVYLNSNKMCIYLCNVAKQLISTCNKDSKLDRSNIVCIDWGPFMGPLLYNKI